MNQSKQKEELVHECVENWYVEGPLLPSAAWASGQTQSHDASNRNFGGDVEVVGEPVKGSLLKIGFGEGGHLVQSMTPTIARMTIAVRIT